MNTGGRLEFALGTEVRILSLDGTISKESYVTIQERSDRNGHIKVRDANSSREINVHFRRILPRSIDGNACVIESRDKYWVICPGCGQNDEVSANSNSFTCSKCAKTYPLHWLGVRPMASKTTTKPTSTAKKEDKKKDSPSPNKAPKAIKEPIKVDLGALTKLGQCELWTNSRVKFDHERIDVKAHVLLFTGTNPRKLCFNTYNGTLGKKATELPVGDFVENKTPKGAKKGHWFPVSDLEKTRAQLAKNGYERAKA